MATASQKNWFEFRNSVNGTTEIAIMDEIGGWGVSARAFREALGNISPTETLDLRINSPGGSITEGNEIYNALKEHKGTVNVRIGAMCASIATVVAMAGDKISIAKNGFFMIHNPFVLAMGDSEEMRKMADIMDKMKAGIVAAYASKTGIPHNRLSAMMDEETWMNAEEAKAEGFVDEIEEDDADAQNNFDLSRFKNSAKALAKQNDKAAGETAGGAVKGTGSLDVTGLEALSKAASALAGALKNTANNQTQKPNTMDQNDPAIQAKIQEQAQAKASELFNQKLKRDGEIKAAAKAVLDRDKKDFSALAEEFIADPMKTVEDFYKALATSDKYKAAKDAVVGSGVESVVEPIDHLKGSPGHAFVASEGGRAILDKWNKSGRHAFSATLNVPEFRNTQTSSGLTSIQYEPGVYKLGVRRLRIKDLLAPGATNQTTIRYRQENAFQDDAAAVTETGTLAALQVSYTEVDAPVKDIGGYIEMSENLMADYLAIASFINERVPYMVERVVEDELLSGSGSGAHITGILNTSGIQTQAKSTDTAVDAIHKAITNIRFVPNAVQANVQGGYEPDAIVINPTDWQNIRLAKDANNQYFGGGPFTAAYGNGAFMPLESLWGKAVVVTPVISAGTALVGAFREAAQYFQRQGLTLEMTNSNGTNFVNRIVTLRAAERLALAVHLPNAFCKVTGL